MLCKLILIMRYVTFIDIIDGFQVLIIYNSLSFADLSTTSCAFYI